MLPGARLWGTAGSKMKVCNRQEEPATLLFSWLTTFGFFFFMHFSRYFSFHSVSWLDVCKDIKLCSVVSHSFSHIQIKIAGQFSSYCRRCHRWKIKVAICCLHCSVITGAQEGSISSFKANTYLHELGMLKHLPVWLSFHSPIVIRQSTEQQAAGNLFVYSQEEATCSLHQPTPRSWWISWESAFDLCLF